MTSPTPYQLLPPLSDEEYAALRADIAEHGIRVPIDVDEHGQVLDGHHRAWITAELGIACPRRVVAGLTEEQKRTHAIAVNVHRRSLSREDKRALIQRSLLSDPHLSDRQHAERTGSDHKTVATQRTQLEERGEIPHVAERTDTRGRQQPVPRPAPAAKEADLLAGDEWTEPESSQEPDDLPKASSLGAPRITALSDPVPPEVHARLTDHRRRPFPDTFTDAVRDLTRAADRLARLMDDDRFPRHQATAHQHVPELLTALEHTVRLTEAIGLSNANCTTEARRWWATSLHKNGDALAGIAQTLTKEKA
ncbi:ParB N-terminal domain-containing protein [Streptomyces sp. NPDC001404]|uniref:ParB N-terminal domain-containing protein n=1 Tax=Streptomyces sp. NPDC001404 TaxID=3364571 RepID=UPI0036C678E2